MKRLLVALAVAVSLAACKGADGAMGPAGPQGPPGTNGLPGPAGPGTRIVITGVAGSSGTVTVTLPTAVGTNPLSPPAMACYLVSDPALGVWIAVNDGYWNVNTPWCAVSILSGVWRASMHNVPLGWTAAFVIVY